MKRTIIPFVLAATLALSACASLQHAGEASYSIEPFNDANGSAICCKVQIHNGKEIANLEAHVSKQGDNYTVDLKEQGVTAFQGQMIAAGALKESIDAAARAAVAAARAAVAAALVPLIPAIAPALAAPGIGAAAVGAGAVIVKDKIAP